MSIIIYHNPRCSKSRQTLELIKQKNIEPQIVEYLKETPSKSELKHILKLLGLKPRDLIRTKEVEYKEQGLDNIDLNDDAILDIMLQYPKLIERPIVVTDNKAAIGRPPEKVLEIL